MPEYDIPLSVQRAAQAARYGEETDTYTWDRVADHVLAATVLLIRADERARITSELKAHMAGFLAHYGNNTAVSLQMARDLAEGITQILDRKPLS